MTTVVVSQPMLFPWPGFFELIAAADVYVHLDDAQFSSNSFTNRIQVKHATGWSWMTIPIQKHGLETAINDLATAAGSWPRRHRDMLSQSLARAPHLDEALSLFDQAYDRRKIVDLLVESIEGPARYLGVWRGGAGLRSSEMSVPGKSWQRVLSIVQALGGTRYVTAHGARHYLDHEAFDRAGVRVEYIAYSKTEYPQLHGGFLPYVTVLDLIAMMGARAGAVMRPSTVPWRAFLRPSLA